MSQKKHNPLKYSPALTPLNVHRPSDSTSDQFDKPQAAPGTCLQADQFQLAPDNLTEELYNAWVGADNLLQVLTPSGNDYHDILKARLLLQAMNQTILDSISEHNPEQYSALGNTQRKLLQNLQQWLDLINSQVLMLFVGNQPDSLAMARLQTQAADLTSRIMLDQKPGHSSAAFKHIEVFFRGIHQMSEVGFWIQRQILKLYNSSASRFENKLLCLHVMARMADRLSEHVMCLKNMDIHAYTQYRPAISGTSGAGSRQLKFLDSQTAPVAQAIYLELQQGLLQSDQTAHQNQALNQTQTMSEIIDTIKNVFNQPRVLPQLYAQLTALHDFETAYLNFWAQHAILAATTVGIGNKGTQDMEVAALFRRVEYKLKKSAILQAISQYGLDVVPESPHLYVHDEDGRRIGTAVSERLERMEISPNVEPTHNISIQQPLITEKSPYASWFESQHMPDLNQYLSFETYGMGLPLHFALESVQQSELNRHKLSNAVWQEYFTKTLPAFQNTMKRVLQIDSAAINITEGGNTTEFIFRLLSAFVDSQPIILTTDREFLAADRAFRSGLHQVHFIETDRTSREAFIPTLMNTLDQIKPDLIFISQVYSNSQWSLTFQELQTLIRHIPASSTLVIDITQGLCNVPMPWGQLLEGQSDIMLLGSCIKHARAGEGVGFLVHHKDAMLQTPRQSGWTACLTGLATGTSITSDNQLAFDQNSQWRGGTPANLAHVKLFQQTWDAVFAAGETLASLHDYVQTMIQYFLGELEKSAGVLKATDLLNQTQLYRETAFASNTLVFANTAAFTICENLQQAGIGCDAKTINGQTYLRLGFGIEHGKSQIDYLLQALRNIPMA